MKEICDVRFGFWFVALVSLEELVRASDQGSVSVHGVGASTLPFRKGDAGTHNGFEGLPSAFLTPGNQFRFGKFIECFCQLTLQGFSLQAFALQEAGHH